MVKTIHKCEKCLVEFPEKRKSLAIRHESKPIVELPLGFVYVYDVERRPTFPNCMAVNVITGESPLIGLDFNHSRTYDAKYVREWD